MGASPEDEDEDEDFLKKKSITKKLFYIIVVCSVVKNKNERIRLLINLLLLSKMRSRSGNVCVVGPRAKIL